MSLDFLEVSKLTLRSYISTIDSSTVKVPLSHDLTFHSFVLSLIFPLERKISWPPFPLNPPVFRFFGFLFLHPRESLVPPLPKFFNELKFFTSFQTIFYYIFSGIPNRKTTYNHYKPSVKVFHQKSDLRVRPVESLSLQCKTSSFVKVFSIVS